MWQHCQRPPRILFALESRDPFQNEILKVSLSHAEWAMIAENKTMNHLLLAAVSGSKVIT